MRIISNLAGALQNGVASFLALLFPNGRKINGTDTGADKKVIITKSDGTTPAGVWTETGDVQIIDGGKVGTKETGTGVPDKEYVLFDRTNLTAKHYVDGGEKLAMTTTQNKLGQETIATTDNSYAFGTHTNRFSTVRGAALGASDGTRDRIAATTASLSIVSSGGVPLSAINTTDGNHVSLSAPAKQYNNAVTLYNKAGLANAVGKIYTGVPGAADYSHGPLFGTAASTLAISTPTAWVCVGAGGVADGSTDLYVPLTDGIICDLLADAACTRGRTLNRSGANAGQVADTGGAAFTPGLTVGVCLATTGGAGLVRSRLCKVVA
jgi:hypothetical protein